MSQPPLVLVSGVTGYIGSVVAAYALAAGYRVRGTVRDLRNDRKNGPIRALRGPEGHVELVQAELDSPAGWADAVKGCTYILHVASPVPTDMPKNAERDVIQPAVNGVLHMLEAAAGELGVTRVVLTSSLAAVNEGRAAEWDTKVFNEDDWSNADECGPYPLSKMRAEQAAWRFLEQRKPHFSLAVINPGLVVGPAATDVPSSSSIVFTRLFLRQMPAVPALDFPTVDVRDVALAHLRAMTLPDAGGRRFLCVARNYPLQTLAKELAAEFAQYGYSIPTGRLPSFLVRLASWFDGALAVVAPSLDRSPKVDNARAVGVLGMTFRDPRVASLQGAYSMIAKGVLPDATPDKRLSTPRPGGDAAQPNAAVRGSVEGWRSYALGTAIDPAELEPVRVRRAGGS